MTVLPEDQGGVVEGGEHLPVLQREVLRPTSDRGRLAALATICSLAGVALGFAMAGTMFAAIPISASPVRVMSVPCTRPAPAWIGVGVRSDGPSRGAWVRAVRLGSPAYANGIAPDDVITAIDSHPVRSNDDLVREVRSRPVGTRVELRIHHGTEDRIQAVVLARMPADLWAAEQRSR